MSTKTEPADMDDVRFLRYIIQERLGVTEFTKRKVMRVTNRFMVNPDRLADALDEMVERKWLRVEHSAHIGKFGGGILYKVTRLMPRPHKPKPKV